MAFTCVFSTTIFAKTISENAEDKQSESEQIVDTDIQTSNTSNSLALTETVEDKVEQKEEQAQIANTNSDIVLENNENAIELEQILMENVSVLKSKEYAEETRPIEFETQYEENPNLPQGEENVIQEGVDGTQLVTLIKSYENNELVGESILSATPTADTTPQIIERGTSEFLAINKVHLNDTMYLTKEVNLKETPQSSANEIITILQSLDVTLVELEGEDWCKINYDGIEGYVESKNLTSSIVTPGIIEANRIQKIKMTLSEDMPLNQSTDLTLEDYQKILSGNSADVEHIIEDNSVAFYNADKMYNINGVLLAAMAIHESAWGTSTIANDKKNLFGYGAYDSSPYSSSFTFETYAEGIDLVARALVKYYLNPEGTPIYDDEIAAGSYYTEPTVAAVNIRYASDTEWHNKVFSYMEYLYDRL